jgi:hypothetical protein
MVSGLFPGEHHSEGHFTNRQTHHKQTDTRADHGPLFLSSFEPGADTRIMLKSRAGVFVDQAMV